MVCEYAFADGVLFDDIELFTEADDVRCADIDDEIRQPFDTHKAGVFAKAEFMVGSGGLAGFDVVITDESVVIDDQ